MKIRSFYPILCLGLFLTLQTYSASTDSSLTWKYDSINEEFGSQIYWDIQGYFEQEEGTISTWTTIGIITTTDDNGDTITSEETGSGTTTLYPDHEFTITLTSENAFPFYEQFLNKEKNLNESFSITYDNDVILLSLDKLITFIFPIMMDNNSKQINLFSSEVTLFEFQDRIRNLLNLSANSTFEYIQGAYAPVVIRDTNDKVFRYHSSGVLGLYTMKNSTNNIRIELDNRNIVVDLTTDILVDDEASDFPFSTVFVAVIVSVIFLRKRYKRS